VATNLGSADESAQIGLALLGASIRRAGSSEIAGSADAGNFRDTLLYGGPVLRACSNARFADPVAGNFGCETATAGAPDSIAVWFQADNALASSQDASNDCIGNQPPRQTVLNPLLVPRAPSGIRVAQNEFFVDGGQLRCRGNGNINAPQPLVAGVEDMKVFFGFDDAGYASNSHDVSRPAASSLRDAASIIALTAPSIPGGSVWDFVVTVHVCLLVRSAEVGVTSQSSAPYRPCPQTAGEAANPAAIATVTATDGALRRAVTQVFSVRSRSAPLPVED
jgi:hypothetical protein